jgi:hypothetical protein
MMFLDYKYEASSKIQKRTYKIVNNSTNGTRIKISQSKCFLNPSGTELALEKAPQQVHL